jgi:transaldolase
MTKLTELYQNCGQSPWLDNIKRAWLNDGTLKKLHDQGVRGVTSNPTIFAKAIESSSDYDEQFLNLIRQDKTIEQAYWIMVKDDISLALDLFENLYLESNKTDGFVSIEVSPEFAHDQAQTLAQAKTLWDDISRPNLLVKIPATQQGLGAIMEMITDGRNVNVTLIFSLERYKEVIDAYISGLEARAQLGVADLSDVFSVASFFVSRIDTEADKRLEAIGTPEALELRGKLAVAQAKVAYQIYLEEFSSERFKIVESLGARPQKLLWASTSTKNPNYPDLLYVDNLIGPNTINTMPDSTLEAFLDHGKLERTLDQDVEESKTLLDKAKEIGLDMKEITDLLETQGVISFKQSYEEVLGVLNNKAGVLKGV